MDNNPASSIRYADICTVLASFRRGNFTLDSRHRIGKQRLPRPRIQRPLVACIRRVVSHSRHLHCFSRTTPRPNSARGMGSNRNRADQPRFHLSSVLRRCDASVPFCHQSVCNRHDVDRQLHPTPNAMTFISERKYAALHAMNHSAPGETDPIQTYQASHHHPQRSTVRTHPRFPLRPISRTN